MRRALRHAGALVVVCAVSLVELVVIDAAQPPVPIGPVHGEVEANGARFAKGGLQWRPDLCRVANKPGVRAVALIRQDAAYPVAWIITDPASGVAAIDVQQASGVDTVRFLPAACSRLHGTVSVASEGGLRGYADAECRDAGAELTLHVDFGACV